MYRKYSVKPPRGLFISNTFEEGWGLIEMEGLFDEGWGGGGGGGGLFNLTKTIVSVLHKDLEYKVENLKYIYIYILKKTQG